MADIKETLTKSEAIEITSQIISDLNSINQEILENVKQAFTIVRGHIENICDRDQLSLPARVDTELKRFDLIRRGLLEKQEIEEQNRMFRLSSDMAKIKIS
jgi:hypothetical protein